MGSNLVDYAHAAGLFVHPWTFRNEAQYWVQGAQSAADEYAQFFAAGVDGVFSDFADAALDIVIRCCTSSEGRFE